jgi:hypothetical protein
MARGKVDRNFIEAGKPHRSRKGQTGNAGAGPKSELLSDAYKFMLAQRVPGDPEGRTWADLAAERMILVAENSGPTKMSSEELVRRVREFYGLSDPRSNTEKPSLN